MNTSAIKIAYLKDHPEEIPALARIWHQVLGKIWLPDIPIERVEQRFQDHLQEDVLPLTLVAFDGNTLVGGCSLRDNDGIRPDLKPWLGSLIVNKAYQNRGVGKLLIEATKKKALSLGYNTLYLFTFDPTLPAYYERQGFHTLGEDHFKGQVVTVMEAIL